MSAVLDREETAEQVAPRRVRSTPRPRRPPVPVPPLSDGMLMTTAALVVIAALCGWAVLQLLGLGSVSQSRAQHDLYGDLREQLAAKTAPIGGLIAPGTPVAVLAIPTLGLEQVVVEGTSSQVLQSGPGHRRDTVLPGQEGVSLVYGRSATYGAPFRSVAQLRAGDGISVTTAQGQYVYRVDGVRRVGDPLPAPPAAHGGRLTLVTAQGSGVLGAIAPDQAVYVDATLQSTAAVGLGGRPAAVPDSEKAFGTDTSGLALTALWLQLLLAAVLGAVLLRRVLPTRLVWVVATPVIIAGAWLAVDSASWLLPNLV